MREINKEIKTREKNTKISLKKENEMLKLMCKYLILLTESSTKMFFYYCEKISKLEKKIKKGVKK